MLARGRGFASPFAASELRRRQQEARTGNKAEHFDAAAARESKSAAGMSSRRPKPLSLSF
jgi:hypothetical protein